jgi:alpha-galactosidase
MVDEMLVAQARWLPQYKKATAEAEKRLKTGKTIPTRDYRGAVRKPIASLASMQRRAEDLGRNTPATDESRPDNDT